MLATNEPSDFDKQSEYLNFNVRSFTSLLSLDSQSWQPLRFVSINLNDLLASRLDSYLRPNHVTVKWTSSHDCAFLSQLGEKASSIMIGRGGSAKWRRSETRVIDLATRPEILSKDDTLLTSSLRSHLMRLSDSRSAQEKPFITVINYDLILRITVSHVHGDDRLPVSSALPHVLCLRSSSLRVASLHLLIAHRRANIDQRNVGCVRNKLCQ